VTVVTLTGKTGSGISALGATRNVIDVECRVTAITSAKVRQLATISSTTRLRYAGSYGLMFTGSGNSLVVREYPIYHSKQDIAEPALIGATDVYWDLPAGVTITLVITY
jgi:hypothetical protein